MCDFDIRKNVELVQELKPAMYYWEPHNRGDRFDHHLRGSRDKAKKISTLLEAVSLITELQSERRYLAPVHEAMGFVLLQRNGLLCKLKNM